MPPEHTAIPDPAGAEPQPLAAEREPLAAGPEPLAPATPQAFAPGASADEADYEPLSDEWAEDRETLSPRPRRRLLGTGGNPIQLALLGVLLLACGFIGGVLVEKGQTSSTTASSGLASRLTALRGAAGTGAGATGGSAGAAGAGGGGGFAGRSGGAGAAGGATIGEVSYVSGDTLYVSDAEGNTVKVKTSAASTITKTVKSDVHGIHPGDTVVVRGTTGAGGAVSAESVSVETAGGGLGALFGGGSGGSGRGGAASGAPSLFGG